MNPITQFLSELSFMQYIFLYLGCFVLAILCVIIGIKTNINLGPLIPVFSLIGGMLAVGYVSIILKPNISIGILVVLAVFASIIILPSLWISDKIKSHRKPEKSNAEICSEEGHQWEPTEVACMTRCKRCGKTKVKHHFEKVPDQNERKCVYCGYTEAIRRKQNKDVSASESKKSDQKPRRKPSKEEMYCPDGSLHEFGEEFKEYEDRGLPGDDDLVAHIYWRYNCRICKKCGYKIREMQKKEGN